MAYVGVKPAAITSATQAEIAGDLTVDTNTLKVDATNNRVGVGLTAPEQPFHVRSSTFAYMRSESTNATYTGLDVGQHQSGYGVINMRDNQDIRFYTNDAEKLRIQAAGGISFNGDTAAANALDDYEEGTWTATLDGTTTGPSSLVAVTGTYIKVGKIVWADALFANVNTTGASGSVRVTGFPFNTGRTTPTGNVMSQSTFNVNSDTANITPFFASSTEIQFYQTLTGSQGWTAVSHSAGTGRYMYFSVVYSAS